jgi:hypothetical protein
MRIRSARFAGALAVAGLVLHGSTPAWAGQAGSIDTSTDSKTYIQTVTTTTTAGGTIVESVSNDVATDDLVKNLDSSLVTLSLQVYDDNYNGYSAHNNVADFAADVTNTIDASGGAASGITTMQQAAGVANVTVSANSLIDGTTLASLGSISGDTTGFATTMVLNPAFAISNSALAARALEIAALTNAGNPLGGGGAVTAIEFSGNDTNELSPHNNIASFAGVVSNSIITGVSTGITQFQQSAGSSNVQTAFNTVLFGADIAAGAGPVFP